MEQAMKVFSDVQTNRRAMLAGAVSLIGSKAIAERAIPEDNLAYPVMVTLKLKDGKVFFGSGFYLNRPSGLYFVTAKHVIFTQNGEMPDAQIELTSYSRDFSAHQPIILSASLSELNAGGNVQAHGHKDVVVVRVATDEPPDGTPTNNLPSTSPAPQPPTPQAPAHSTLIRFVAGITVSAAPGTVIVSFGPEAVRTYDQVTVGNDAIVYGYPRSLGGLSPDKQFDLDPVRPLLRKG
jgi:hypothetical protein